MIFPGGPRAARLLSKLLQELLDAWFILRFILGVLLFLVTVAVIAEMTGATPAHVLSHDLHQAEQVWRLVVQVWRAFRQNLPL